MGNSYFQFKQFKVFHDRCAMKVGTDGVLLGAWTNFDGCRSVLDVGTGSGLIALMAAQRNDTARITALEIDPEAALQAEENIAASPFKKRTEVKLSSFQDFASAVAEKFDLIVSNPPFFTCSLPSPHPKRTHARHAETLSLNELLGLSRKMLHDSGKISLIYPFSEMEKVKSAARREALFRSRETMVFPTVSSSPKRVLLEFTRTEPEQVVETQLVIEMQRGAYTPEFIQLVKDFYLRL